MECYTCALQKYPVDAAAYSNRAMVNLKLEKYAEAIHDANKALEIDADYVKAYHRRGKAYLATGQNEQALHDFEQCIARSPNDAEILECLGEACERIDEEQARGFENDMGQTQATTTGYDDMTGSEAGMASSIQMSESSFKKSHKDSKPMSKTEEEQLRLFQLE